jgi:hypothetical protein
MVEWTPDVERALFLMLCDKELRRLDPLRKIISERWSLRTVEQLLADGVRHYCFKQAPAAARDRLLNMATEYMSNNGTCVKTCNYEPDYMFVRPVVCTIESVCTAARLYTPLFCASSLSSRSSLRLLRCAYSESAGHK